MGTNTIKLEEESGKITIRKNRLLGIDYCSRTSDSKVYSDRYEIIFKDESDYLDHCDCEGDDPEEDLYKVEDVTVQLRLGDIKDHLLENIFDWLEYTDEVDFEDWYKGVKGLDELKSDLENAIKKFNEQQVPVYSRFTEKLVKVEPREG